MSCYVLKNEIRGSFNAFQSETTALLCGLDYVCLTADIWGTRHASYLGITCHYLDCNTFERKSLALNCSRFHYPHTNENIAEEIQILYSKYGLDTRKIVATVTDNASNFVKAFREFGANAIDERADDSTEMSINENDENQSEELTFTDISMSLSKHIRCASHTLNLIATVDSANAKDNRTYAKIYVPTFSKLNCLWNKTRRPKSSETIREMLGSGLSRPGQTRWNSLYRSIVQILTKDKDSLENLMLELEITPFTCIERQFLEEYTDVMSSIAAALDNLQKTNCHYGILLPTLYATKAQLKDHIKNKKIKHCVPLANALLNGVHSRFGNLFDFNSTSAETGIIATCTHPHFKLGWLGPDKSDHNINIIKRILLKTANQIHVETEKPADVREVDSFSVERSRFFYMEP